MSTVLVSVPGQQPEKTTPCPHCNKDVPTEPRSEKGVDTSMVTYLYEASEQWDRVFLFTNDADFVPPILALRRRGKRVFVAAIETKSASALRRVCQSFFAVPPTFLERDLAMFRMLQPGGAVDQALDKVRDMYPGIKVWFSADGESCPMFLLEKENADVEKLLVNLVGIPRQSVVWLSSSHGREGRIFSRERHLLGEAVRRHRQFFGSATWSKCWRDC